MKTFANIGFLSLLLLQHLTMIAQDSSLQKRENLYNRLKQAEILAGVSWQGNLGDKVPLMRYAEIGIAKSIHAHSRHGPATFGIYAAEEIHITDANSVFGTKLGFYTHYMFDIGFAVIYYTDFKKGNLKLRPELGVGMGALRAVFGFNIPTINNRAFELLRQNNAQLTLQFMIPVKKKDVTENRENIFRQLLKK